MKKQISQFLCSKTFLISIIFSLALVAAEVILFSVYYQNFHLIDYLKSGFYFIAFRIVFLGLLSFLLTEVFIWIALASPYKFRFLFFVLFCLAVLTEYGYQGVFERFTNLEDTANALYAADFRIMSNSIADYFDYPAIVPCAAFGILLVLVKPLFNNGLKPLLFVALLFAGFFSFTAYFTSNAFPSLSLSAFYRTAFSFPVNWYIGSMQQPAFNVLYQTPRREVKFRALEGPKNNIVFIIDESVRGDHLSINGYPRNTTPFLDELNQKGVLRNWGITVSGATCSINSNNLLLTGVVNLPDVNGEIFKSPTIFQYAKAMNYKTHYFDGQLSYRWIGKATDMKDIDQWTNASKLKKENWYDVDAEIAQRVRQIVQNSTGNFIWINKFGVHKPYNPSYPESETKWLPIPQTDSNTTLSRSKNIHEETKNNYDNAILYNSQSFFSNLFDDGVAGNTFYVYTSDHGQNLGEDGRRTISHCYSTKGEASVPLFIISQPQTIPEVDTNYKASHANLFATLLDLMNFPESERQENYQLSLFKAKEADSTPRFYFAGGLYSNITGKKYPFDD
jgi:glucan phosphoethanolaminetransferase (alkaline phosphatase superfamily)